LLVLRIAGLAFLALDLALLQSFRSLTGASSLFHLTFHQIKQAPKGAAIEQLMTFHLLSSYSCLSNHSSFVYAVSLYLLLVLGDLPSKML
jgi:hypothetical protein